MFRDHLLSPRLMFLRPRNNAGLFTVGVPRDEPQTRTFFFAGSSACRAVSH